MFQFIILVVDSTDRERLSITKEELCRMLANEVSFVFDSGVSWPFRLSARIIERLCGSIFTNILILRIFLLLESLLRICSSLRMILRIKIAKIGMF